MADLMATIADIGFVKILGTVIVIGLLIYAFVPKKPGSNGSSGSNGSNNSSNNDGGQQ